MNLQEQEQLIVQTDASMFILTIQRPVVRIGSLGFLHGVLQIIPPPTM